MAHIEWAENLNTGISVIDKQHRRIVEYINLLDDVRITQDNNQVSKVLKELVDYTLSHFAFEESLMEEANYGLLVGHKRVHQMFVRRIEDFQQRFNMGESIAEELLIVLKSWLINHIQSDDNDYAAVVKSNMGVMNKTRDEGWIGRSIKKFFG